jgi:hypothetical protein
MEFRSGKIWQCSAGERQGGRQKQEAEPKHLKALPMGKNVTFENRRLPCFFGFHGNYLLCRITVEPSVAEQAVPYPPSAVITMTDAGSHRI